MTATRERRSGWLTLLLASIAIFLPAGFFVALRFQPERKLSLLPTTLAAPPASSLRFEQATVAPAKYRPLITNVQIVDLDRDGLADVLACDARRQRVIWYRQRSRGQWQEKIIGDSDLLAPCRVRATDLDRDGDLDLVVAVLGSVRPTDERVGRVVWLENRGNHTFTTHVILDDMRRVADVEVADLNGDKVPDLAVAEFGNVQGRVLWLEGRGDGSYRDHVLLAMPGTVNVIPADLDGDGDLDLAALVSQDEESVWGFENLGNGQFRRHVMHSYVNFDLGSVQLVKTDLDDDDKPDFLLVAGDNFEVRYSQSQPWHGCFWLAPDGSWSLKSKRIASLGGAYGASVADLDGDRDLDVVLVSLFNDWRRPDAASVIWLENDGKQAFRSWRIADKPTHLCSVATGDLDGDGRADIVASGFHVQEPFDHIGRITAWLSRKEKR